MQYFLCILILALLVPCNSFLAASPYNLNLHSSQHHHLQQLPQHPHRIFNSFELGSSHSATESVIHMPPADLTPAVDKFVCLPSDNVGDTISNYFMSAKGPVPEGPEPFSMVAKELQPLSDYVKELVASENPVLTMAASHFFDSVSREGGKNVHSFC